MANSTGNFIFRNQPNHSYFDKPFDDENDCLFQLLNEIDPHFLKTEQQAERIDVISTTVIDPRTQKPIAQLQFDHTKEEETKIFQSPKKSLMTENQHEMGVRVLNSLQKCLEVAEEDKYNWYRLQKTRIKEVKCFQKFALEFNQSIKEQMYAPCRKLLQLYQKWYKSRAFKLMRRYPQDTYNTHLGLPQVRQCTNILSDLPAIIINKEIESTVGEKYFWENNMKEDIKKFNDSISSYADAYEHSEDLKDQLEYDLQLHFVKIAEQEIRECPYFYIPLESLVFLLTPGDYIDTPTEMLLNIKETKNSEGDFDKVVIMELPLPSRQCGWHTYEQVVEQAATAMFSINQTKLVENEIYESKVVLNNVCDFKVSTLEDFMEKSTAVADKLCKFSRTLIKWQLGTLEDDQCFQLFTSMDDYAGNTSVVLKLEYKPTFGCEVLTKYVLLKEWLKLQLNSALKSSCLRLDVSSYSILLEEPLNTHKLEECLSSVYHINCKILLNNLFEFLKMLYNMPAGHYMLRYNPRFKDKLMLCKPSKEITQNTINLHNLLDTDATDIEFMSENNFIPIDENLCSLMHFQHKILPAAFSPRGVGKKICLESEPFYPKPKIKVAQTNEIDNKTISNKTRKKRIRRKEREYDTIRTKNTDSK